MMGKAPHQEAGLRRFWRPQRHGRIGVGGAALAVVLLLFIGLQVSAGMAATAADVAIQSVGGQSVRDGRVARPVSGDVEVAGTATTAASGTPAVPALVADAGDSGFVATGETAVLNGIGFGGAAPYTFAWSASAGKLTDAASAMAKFVATDLAPGTYDVALKVTDRLGQTATDTVKMVVFAPQSSTVLDEDGIDQPPGAVAVGWVASFPFTVAAHTRRLTADLSFGEASSDYALRVVDPDGNQVAESNGAPGQAEKLDVADPKSGEWTAEVVKWTPYPDAAHLVVTAQASVADPRPVVSAGGPYAFPLGGVQQFAGSVSGGSAPVSVGWDLDGDGVFTDAAGAGPTVASSRAVPRSAGITASARSAPSTGPNGRAKPIQYATSNGSRAIESQPPRRGHTHRRTPTTTSAAQTTTKPTRSGTVVGMPTSTNGPLPYVGRPMNCQTEPYSAKRTVPIMPGMPKPRPRSSDSPPATLLSVPASPRVNRRRTPLASIGCPAVGPLSPAAARGCPTAVPASRSARPGRSSRRRS